MFQHLHYSVAMISEVGVANSLVNWFGFVLPTKDQFVALHLFNIIPFNHWWCNLALPDFSPHIISWQLVKNIWYTVWQVVFYNVIINKDIFDSHKSRLIQIGMLETHRSLLWSNINKNNNKFKAVLYINKVSCSWWWSNHIKRWTGFACILLSTRQGSEFMPVNLCWRRSRQKICTWLLPQCGLYLHILCFRLLLFCPLPNYTLICWRQNTDQYRMYTVNSYCNDTRRIDTKLRSKSYPITDCCYILQGCSHCFQISLSRSLFFARVHLSCSWSCSPASSFHSTSVTSVAACSILVGDFFWQFCCAIPWYDRYFIYTVRTELSFWPSICHVGCRWVNHFDAWTQLIAKRVW